MAGGWRNGGLSVDLEITADVWVGPIVGLYSAVWFGSLRSGVVVVFSSR